MGNTTSGAFIAIKITNDPSIPIVGGSAVNGIVYLDVENESIPCDSLNVCLLGHEKTRVVYYETGDGCQRSLSTHLLLTSSYLSHSHFLIYSLTLPLTTVQDGKETKQVKKLDYETHIFLTLDCVLAMFPQGKVAKGRYEFPFVFPLPPGIPGRLYASSLSGEDTFVISYHLEARLHRKDVITTTTAGIHHNNDITTTTGIHHNNEVKNSVETTTAGIHHNSLSEVKNSLEIMVCDPPRPVIPCPSFVDPVTTPMRFYCCLSTGTMTLMCSLDNGSVDAGEETKVNTPLQLNSYCSCFHRLSFRNFSTYVLHYHCVLLLLLLLLFLLLLFLLYLLLLLFVVVVIVFM